MFTLAVQAGKLLTSRTSRCSKERNTRTGFFEPEQLDARARAPAGGDAAGDPVRLHHRLAHPVSEVLPLEWRQVDFEAGEIRLDPETTKNRDGRVFPMTDDLRALLERRSRRSATR